MYDTNDEIVNYRRCFYYPVYGLARNLSYVRVFRKSTVGRECCIDCEKTLSFSYFHLS